jgi:hypothetical protein
MAPSVSATAITALVTGVALIYRKWPKPHRSSMTVLVLGKATTDFVTVLRPTERRRLAAKELGEQALALARILQGSIPIEDQPTDAVDDHPTRRAGASIPSTSVNTGAPCDFPPAA